ncbi:MAG: hypothetical protein AAGG01_08625 [Planctomycetota bacterium]
MKNLLIAALTLLGTYSFAHLAYAETLICGESDEVGKVFLWQYECVDGYPTQAAAESAALARVADMLAGGVENPPVCVGSCWAPFIGYHDCTGGFGVDANDPDLVLESGFDPDSGTWWACVTTMPGQSVPLEFSCAPCLVPIVRP